MFSNYNSERHQRLLHPSFWRRQPRKMQPRVLLRRFEFSFGASASHLQEISEAEPAQTEVGFKV